MNLQLIFLENERPRGGQWMDEDEEANESFGPVFATRTAAIIWAENEWPGSTFGEPNGETVDYFAKDLIITVRGVNK